MAGRRTGRPPRHGGRLDGDHALHPRLRGPRPALRLRPQQRRHRPAHQGQSFSQARVQSYAAIVATGQVTRPVVRELKLPTTPGELAGRITAEAPLNTVLINIKVSDTQPQRAARTANAVALRFAGVVERLETPADGQVPPVTLGITEQAAAPGAPVSPNGRSTWPPGCSPGSSRAPGSSSPGDPRHQPQDRQGTRRAHLAARTRHHPLRPRGPRNTPSPMPTRATPSAPSPSAGCAPICSSRRSTTGPGSSS